MVDAARVMGEKGSRAWEAGVEACARCRLDKASPYSRNPRIDRGFSGVCGRYRDNAGETCPACRGDQRGSYR